MKRSIRNIIFAGALLLPVLSFAQGSAEADVLLVKTKPGVTGSLLDATIGATLKRDLGFGGWRAVRISRSVSMATAERYYKSNPGVVAVERSYKHELLRDVNDPRKNQLYWIPIIKANQAWALTTGSPNVVVAIVDTGVDYNHEDLKSKIVPGGKDISDGDDDPMDTGGHGTHCAGIAAAATNNNIGVASIGYNVRILPVKVFPQSSDDTVAAGIKYAADQGAKVISLSLGRFGTSALMQEAVNYATAKGSLCVAAAGNNGLDVTDISFVPSNLDNVLNVASTNSSDVRSGFSNYSATKVDIAAPGEGIMSTFPGTYGYASGTSMACPMVAGLAALVKSYAPTATPKELTDVLKLTADKMPFVESGRINAYRAVDYFTITTPISSSLVSKGVHQGTATSGSGAFLNVRSVLIPGYGQAAAFTATHRLPVNPLSQLRDVNVSTTFTPVATGTAQLFLWNYRTSKHELVLSGPASKGSLVLSSGTLPAQYIQTGTRNVGIVVRIVIPNVRASSFVFNANTLTGLFKYRLNP